MRAIDAAAVARDGEVALMRAAGEAIAHADRPLRARRRAGRRARRRGNNGGDAYAALAVVRRTRAAASCTRDPGAGGSAARRDARERARVAGVEERPFPPDAGALRGASLVLDGVLGVNARLPLDARRARRSSTR